MIQYVIGDASRPKIGTRVMPWVIAHVCNDSGGWGAGFTGALSPRWLEAERQYRTYWRALKLGEVQYVSVSGNVGQVANMIAQRGYGRSTKPRIDYDALDKCLNDLGAHCRRLNAAVHMPRIGCGLAGGRWEEVEPLIARNMTDVSVTVYDLPR